MTNLQPSVIKPEKATVTQIQIREANGDEITIKTITYPNGSRQIMSYKDNIAHGPFTDYFEGRMTYSGSYKDGRRIGQHKFFENGTCVRVYDANNDKTTYYPNRNPPSRLI